MLGVKAVENRILIKSGTVPHDIRARIVGSLHRQAQLDAQNIAVAVDGDMVTLSEAVSPVRERNAALRVAWAATGVTRVVNKIELAG